MSLGLNDVTYFLNIDLWALSFFTSLVFYLLKVFHLAENTSQMEIKRFVLINTVPCVISGSLE